MKGKIKLLVFVGIFITILPILGFPRSLKTIILFTLGIVTIILTLSLRRGIKTLKLKLKRIEGQQGTFVQ